jgi:hypothetical protein
MFKMRVAPATQDAMLQADKNESGDNVCFFHKVFPAITKMLF